MQLGTDTIATTLAHANLDAFYGPWDSVAQVYERIPSRYRKLGLTVGVIENGSVVEYQWKTGISNDDLKRKVDDLRLKIKNLGTSEIHASQDDILYISFNIDGLTAISEGLLYRVEQSSTGEVEVLIEEITSLVKGDNTHILPTPSTPGVYKYRLKVRDASSTLATNDSNGLNYIEYLVQYGNIEVKENFSRLTNIALKNAASLSEEYFWLTIDVRDPDVFKITGVSLRAKDDTSKKEISLMGYTSTVKTTPTEDYLGLNYYYLPATDGLKDLEGHECEIVVKYTEDGLENEVKKDLFTILNSTSLTLISETSSRTYYKNVPATYTFHLESGTSNVVVSVENVTNGNKASSFTFNKFNLSTYTTFGLTIIPSKITDSAVLSFKCTYYIDNKPYTKTFTDIIGAIEDIPEQAFVEGNNTLIREPIVSVSTDKDDFDGQEGGQLYKYTKNNFSFTTSNKAIGFILDLYVKINKQENPTDNLILVKKSNSEIINITPELIYINNDLYEDTPIGEWVLIGVGMNLILQKKGTQSVHYNCIYINGQVAKNITITPNLESEISSSITVEMVPNILVGNCFIYYPSDSRYVSPLAPNSSESIIYKNYLNHSQYKEPTQDLPILQLKKVDYATIPPALLKALYENKVRYLTTFGEVGSLKSGTMSEYIGLNPVTPLVENSSDEYPLYISEATLLRLGVNIKSNAQKPYAVLCTGSYVINGKNVFDDIFIEVHTQGTSTLTYPIPNFKFTFWKYDNSQYVKTKLNLIGDFFESSLTAKADSMDSSHLNNTPTCMYYNEVIKTLGASDTYKDLISPAAREHYVDAIAGIPIIMEINEAAEKTAYTNIGSFMLNIDKSGDSLGFEVTEDCLSFEGTSNSEEVGGAGRFIKDDSLEYFENETEIEAAFNIVDPLIKDKTLSNSAADEYKYTKWCKFLSNGLEYRYPESDLYKVDADTDIVKAVCPLTHFKRLYNMWEWVSKSDSYENPADYRNDFELHFNVLYCMLYYIQLMVYGQSDNLGKNAMFDTWGIENGKELWYPRPYDLDSQAGIDNNGYDIIPTFSEVNPKTSLNYRALRNDETAEDYERFLTENYLLSDSAIHAYTINRNNNLYYIDYARYPYSSNNSKLWANFYNNYKEQINNFYIYLRTNCNYNAESIIAFCEENVINKLGIKQYNEDFNNKYLFTNSQYLMMGNRWSKFKKWITNRFAFCDSYFRNTNRTSYDFSGIVNFNFSLIAPLYVYWQYQKDEFVKFILSNGTISTGGQGATKIDLRMAYNQVKTITLFNQQNLKTASLNNSDEDFSNLLTLDLSNQNGHTNLANAVGTKLDSLKTLNISGTGITDLANMPASLMTLKAQKITLNTLSFKSGSLIEEIDLSNSIITSDIEFTGLTNLKTLILDNCRINGEITFNNLPVLNSIKMSGTTFNNNVHIQAGVNVTSFNFSGLNLHGISFDGDSAEVEELNFKNTSFSQDTININLIKDSIKKIDISGSTGLKRITADETPTNLTTFNITNSQLEVFGRSDNSEYFDASKLPEELSTFTFSSATKIKIIRNLNWEKKTGKALFRNCTSLTEINGKLTFIDSIEDLFRNCTNLKTLPDSTNIEIDSSVTSARNAFASTNSLSYTSQIVPILQKCTKVKDFYMACAARLYENKGEIINLTTLFANNTADEIDVSSMFTLSAHGSTSAYTTSTARQPLTIQGKLPKNTTKAYYMFFNDTVAEIPYNIFADCTKITDIHGFLNSATVTKFTGSAPTLNEATIYVDSRFFPTSVVDISYMFLDSNIQPYDNALFSKLVSLQLCRSIFAKFSSNRLLAKNIDCAAMWSNCPNIKDISASFFGNINAYIGGDLKFHEDRTSTIDISALCGLSKFDKNSIECMMFTTDNLTTSNVYYTSGTKKSGFGVFMNRKVKLQTTTKYANLRGNCSNMFLNALLLITSPEAKFDLSNVTNCSNMFNSAVVYNTNNNGVDFLNDIKMPESCSDYSGMFKNSVMLNTLPTIEAGASELSEMFASNRPGTDKLYFLSRSSFNLSASYFNKCKATITKVDKMFQNNNQLDSLQYSSDNGLLKDCVNLEAVESMFEGCYYLRDGIPNNLFGASELAKIQNLKNMFKDTLILFHDKGTTVEGTKKISSNTFAPLSNVEYLEGMFQGISYYIYNPRKSTDAEEIELDSTIINKDTFSDFEHLRSINNLFRNTPINFSNFSISDCETAEHAFEVTGHQSNHPSVPEVTIDSNFIKDRNKLTNVTEMFAMENPNSNRTINGLNNFLQQLGSHVIKMNVDGNVNGNTWNNNLPSDAGKTIIQSSVEQLTNYVKANLLPSS